MPESERFAILREHLTESGWACDEQVARHPLLGRHGLISALLLNGEAAAAAAMCEAGLVYGSLWNAQPRAGLC